MRDSCRLTLPLVLLALLLSGATPAVAQVFGTFPWQMQPYCNVVTLTLASTPAGFTLDGSDDQCGATNKGSVVGTATFNASGNVTLNFTVVAAPGGQPVHVSAVVSPGTGSGAWTDSAERTGTFAFFGASPGLPPRPADDTVAFRVSGHGTATLLDAVTVTVPWSALPEYNIGGGTYSPGNATYTVPRAGAYLVTTTAAWELFSSPNNYKCLMIRTNTTIRASVCEPPWTTTLVQLQGLSTVVRLNPGDTIDIRAFQGSGNIGRLAVAQIPDVHWSVTLLR